MTRGSPIVKVLLNMCFDSRRVSNNIIIETYVFKFNRVFMSIKMLLIIEVGWVWSLEHLLSIDFDICCLISLIFSIFWAWKSFFYSKLALVIQIVRSWYCDGRGGIFRLAELLSSVIEGLRWRGIESEYLSTCFVCLIFCCCFFVCVWCVWWYGEMF